jgi:hypothetical protein
MRLRSKVALLTGAAAHLFVREGAKVVLTDICDELGERAADTYVTRVTDRPSFKNAPADQLAHFAAAEESRSAAG